MKNELNTFELQRFAQEVFAAKNYDEDDGVIYNARSTAMTITADFENTELSYEDYEDSVVTIDASKTVYGIEISGNENDNSIKGGSGDDILDGGEGNDTLTGGRGNDTFIFRRYAGNDVITDYKPGEDTIEIAEGAINDYKTSGSDIIFNIGSNTLTIKNGSGKELTVTDENGNTTTKEYEGIVVNPDKLPLGVKYNANQTTLTISKKFEDEEIDLADYSDKVKTINSTAFNGELTITANENDNVIKIGKKATTVYGGSGNDQITGGKGADALYGEDDDDKLVGGSGADTLSGGDGDDTMTGGAGKDLFIYDGNGDDIITDYKAGQDTIYLAEDIEFESVTVKGKNVTFNLDGGSLTIKGGKNKKITFVDEDGEVIDTVKYKKSEVFDTNDEDDDDERDFVESVDNVWFAQDNNFIGNDNANINSILNSDTANYNVGNINTSNVMNNFTQDKQSINNIVYSKINK